MTPTEKSFEEIIPFLGIENNVLIAKKGGLSLFYKLNMPSVFSMAASQFDDLNQVLANSISALPKNYALARYDLVTPQNVNLQYPQIEFLSPIEKRERHYFKDRPFIKTDSYLVITKLPEASRKATWFNTYFSSSNVSNFSPESQDIEELQTHAERVVEALSDAIQASNKDQNCRNLQPITQLMAEEITDLLLYQFLNLSLEQPRRFDAEILNEEDCMVVGSKVATVLSMNDDGYPGEVFSNIKQAHGSAHLPVSMLHSLQFNLAFPHIIINIFYPKAKHEAAEMLDQNLNRFGSLLKGRSGSYNDALYSEVNNFLENFRKDTSQSLVSHHFSVVVVGDKNEPAQHTTHCNQVRNLLLNVGSQFNESLFSTFAKFHALLPGNVADVPETERGLLTAEAAACFWNFESAYHESKYGVRFTDRKGKPLMLDIWNDKNLNNRNFVVIGQSGTGKTFTLLNIIDQFLTLGYQVVAVDKVGNYKTLADSYGERAKFVECSEKYPLEFNPFIVSKDDTGCWKPTADEIELIVKTIYIALRLEDGNDSKNIEDKALEALLGAFFKEIKSQTDAPTFEQFYMYIESMSKDVQNNFTRGKFDFDEFLVGMKSFRMGENYGQILNGASNEDLLHRNFVVFDNKNVDENDTLKVLMSYVSGLIIAHKLLHRSNKEQPLVILFDEAWSNLESSMGKYLIQYLYRCCRRFLGSVGIITQSIEDIERSALRDIISANATMVYSFKPAENSRSTYKKLFSLTDHQLDLLYSLEQKQNSREIFLKTGDFANVYGVEVSPYARIALSSKMDDQTNIQQYYEVSGNLEGAILEVVEKRGIV
jgi:type IV secretory pathway VirB4 component